MLYPKPLSLPKIISNQRFMASIKTVIRKKKNSKGQYPITIRITKNRKSSFIYTGQYIDEKHWDAKDSKVKKSHPNSAWLNNFIAKKLAEANDKLLELESQKDVVSSQTVTSEIKTNKGVVTFFELAETYLQHLIDKNQFSRVSSEKPRINHFRKFLKGKDIIFSEISEILLKQFQAYLKQKRGNSDRSIVNTLIVIRTLFNLAIREGIVDRKYYPFGKGGIIIRFPQSVKMGLTKEEVEKLENVELEDPREHHARNIWLFSFYFAGMRVSDVLKMKWSDFKDGRMFYQMGKNAKVLSLKIPDKAQTIINQYENEKRSKDDFIFPEMKIADLSSPKDIRQKVANGNKKNNKYLKKVAEKLSIDKSLTMHIARHTFGHISGDRIPVQVLQMLYRHSDITTTINYQNNFTYKQADDALEKVLS